MDDVTEAVRQERIRTIAIVLNTSRVWEEMLEDMGPNTAVSVEAFVSDLAYIIRTIRNGQAPEKK